ncbi:MAG: ATP-dependent Clp protease proteolytic subunit [Candidatus Saccharibacteria bacterium]|nr:ATP-dependent Clp protease proteolytic subunit [Candidatus Saccharibacteria bacterium]MCY4088616.1 ATP-dependent Clp protease proteolytic subunit [Candidatus Saccharibacteria bacterium]
MSKKSINPNQILIPTVIEQEANGTRVYDIYSRLLEGRIVFLGSLINNDVANLIVAQLLFLEQKESTDDIYLYINSPGGSVSAGMAIFDTMNYIKADVHTICVGQAASMGAFLLANGTSGKRSILPHAKVMLHQPWADGITGQVTDIEITTKELLKTKQLLNKILADKTGQSLDKLQTQVERDYWLDAKEAQKYGLVDNILNQRLIPSKKK